MAYRLGIDLGTTNTVASVAADGAPLELVGLGARSQQMRSTLFFAEDGEFVVGDAAADRAASDPSRLIIDPRRQLGTDVPMVVGGQEVTAEQATAAVINFVVGRATAEQHEPPSETVLSHPAHWDGYRVECFDRAIAAANLGSVRRCTDAEAAVATHAARESLHHGQRVVVYDLGGGSCEVTVIEKTPAGVRVLGDSEGADHPSGADFDEAVFRLVLSNLGDRGRDLEKPDPDSRLRSAEIRRASAEAKEALSTATEAQVPVSLPGYTTTIRLGRQEFASLVRPVLRDSIAMITRVLRAGGVQTSDLAAIVLVGGCCRMPVVTELLQREFRAPIALGTHPEYDVAIGTLLVPYTGEVTATSPAVLPSDSVAAAQTAPAEEGRIEKELPEAQQPQSEPDVEHAQAPHLDISQPQAEQPDVDQPQAAADVIADSAKGDATVITEAPKVWAPTVATEADQPAEQQPAVAPTPASAAEHSPVPDFTSTDSEANETVPGEPAPSTGAHTSMTGAPLSTAPSPSLPPWAQASAAVQSHGSATVGPSPSVQTAQYRTPMTSAQHSIGQHPPGSPPHRPGSSPSPGQYPPVPRPPGSPGSWSPNYPRPPTSSGQWGSGGPGGYPPWPDGRGPDPGGSRLRLFLIIVGVAVLVGASVAVGVLISRRGQPSSTTSPSVSIPPAGSLPSSAAIPESVVVVPMRRDAGPDGPLYLVDTEAKIKRVELPTPGGGNSNPMMPASRNTIIYANAGKLRVMAADGSGDRKLFNRDPAGCARVEHASWSLADPSVLLISCRVSKTKVTLLVVGIDGSLIRRLDTGVQIVRDATLSPDGQTVLYSVASSTNADVGTFYTLPIIGTGAPKQLTNFVEGIDADPAWSPDGSQIAFRRRVPTATIDGNEEIFVMKADGSGVRAVARSPAADLKPVWSPDNKNLLIISNRNSDTGGPGKTFDLWLVRESDGKVLRQLGLKAKQITQPFWMLR
jgi:molecular chaperone DnaK